MTLLRTGNSSFFGNLRNDSCCKQSSIRCKKLPITELTNQVKELRSEFVDRRSELMKLKKWNQQWQKKWKLIEIFPSEVPPVKIVVESQENKKSFGIN